MFIALTVASIFVVIEKADLVNLGLEMRTLAIPRSPPGVISQIELYNALNQVSRHSAFIYNPLYMLIIDTRSVDDYTNHHIQSAVHCTTLADNKIATQIRNFLRIVVYGYGENRESENRTGPSLQAQVVRLLSELELDFEIMEGTYDSYYERFPFICNQLTCWTEPARHEHLNIYPSLILEDWCYQGAGYQATDEELIKSMGITHIINITTDLESSVDGIQYLNINLQDEGKSDLYPHFLAVQDFMDSCKKEEGKILIHCNMGISRSSAASLAYIMKQEQCSLLDAFAFLKSRRQVCAPNRGFLLQLAQFELFLFGESVTDATELWLNI